VQVSDRITQMWAAAGSAATAVYRVGGVRGVPSGRDALHFRSARLWHRIHSRMQYGWMPAPLGLNVGFRRILAGSGVRMGREVGRECPQRHWESSSVGGGP
jgi:hypothetical protein